ncbi:hypothetical protein [Polaromonas sp. YR568]|uniref:hypothetical protein n=1 Tax=Polaromonas sp. YR568 TaxID=1855301 RepID=UPI00398BEE01
MQAAAPAKMTPDTGPRGAAVTVFSCSPPSAASPKVTFHPLDIFLPRSKLRCNARARLHTRHCTRHARIF